MPRRQGHGHRNLPPEYPDPFFIAATTPGHPLEQICQTKCYDVKPKADILRTRTLPGKSRMNMTKACMTVWGKVEAVLEAESVVDMDMADTDTDMADMGMVDMDVMEDMEVTDVVKDTVDMEDTENTEEDTEDTVEEDTEHLVPDSRTALPNTPKISLTALITVTKPMTTRKRHRSGRVELVAAWAAAWAVAWAVEGLVDSLVRWAVVWAAVWAAEWAPEWVVGDSEFRICLGW
ncbi:MAG: hypothetical protein L6R42_008368 [Xanthoria sp. 1 TBL-2021]|nr:MAG: hypothetical protein L6R42_008368 [Xanthoria sp. 1 TBL-2021]